MARATATQVILVDNGRGVARRFRRSNGREIGPHDRHGVTAELRRLDDPEVVKIRARQIVGRLVDRIAAAKNEYSDPAELLEFIEAQTARVRAVENPHLATRP